MVADVEQGTEPPATPVVTVPANPVKGAPVPAVRDPAKTAPHPAELAKAEPPAAPVVRDAADPAAACSRDEQRLARLRADPVPEQIFKFQKELGCARLRAQVQRLMESLAIQPQSVPAPGVGPKEPPQAAVQPAPVEDPCVRDRARLNSLRASRPRAPGTSTVAHRASARDVASTGYFFEEGRV